MDLQTSKNPIQWPEKDNPSISELFQILKVKLSLLGLGERAEILINDRRIVLRKAPTTIEEECRNGRSSTDSCVDRSDDADQYDYDDSSFAEKRKETIVGYIWVEMKQRNGIFNACKIGIDYAEFTYREEKSVYTYIYIDADSCNVLETYALDDDDYDYG